MHKYIDYLRKQKRDLEENLENYLKALKDLAAKYNGKLYIFGSYIKGEAIAASDVDILIEIPDDVDRLKVLHEARKITPNTKVEMHVLNKEDAEIFKKIIKNYVEIL